MWTDVICLNRNCCKLLLGDIAMSSLKKDTTFDLPAISETLECQLNELFGDDYNWWFDDYNRKFGATNREIIERGHMKALENYLDRQLLGIPN
jgi:hypothetical protein